MFTITPIMPAYARAPKSKKAAQADLDNGLDWHTANGRAINKSELLTLMRSGTQIEARSADKRKLWMLTL